MPEPTPILAAFASGSEDLIPEFLERFQSVPPDLPLYVVSEFAPPAGVWIPYALGRTAESVFELLDNTLQSGQRELQLVESQEAYVRPARTFQVLQVR